MMKTRIATTLLVLLAAMSARSQTSAGLADPTSTPFTASAATVLDSAEAPQAFAEADGSIENPEQSHSLTHRNGLEIHQQFLGHLAGSGCDDAQDRWQTHYARAPQRLANPNDELLALFGYVLDEIVKAGLPSEYALIPFIESRYTPAAKSNAGPAGMWQFIATTARNQGITMSSSYDGRYSVIESTRAAISYLKHLHDMFGQNWQLATMGYNAGERRILSAIHQSGQSPRNADLGKISSGIPAISRAYVRKMHSITCLFKEADKQEQWRRQIDRPVPLLQAFTPDRAGNLRQWAAFNGLNYSHLSRLNPALTQIALRTGNNAPQILAPRIASMPAQNGSMAPATELAGEQLSPELHQTPANPTHYTVKPGDSLWSITRRHGISSMELMRLNGLRPTSTLRPGMVLKLDETRP